MLARTPSPLALASAAFEAADEAYNEALAAAFGAGNVAQARIGTRGFGEPGKPLRAAFDAWRAARDTLCAIQDDMPGADEWRGPRPRKPLRFDYFGEVVR